MTPEQIAAVQQSWAQVVPIRDTAATLFYDRLFQIAPQVRPLFAQADMAEQRRKLMMMIATAVNSLNDLPAVVPAVQALGRRHAGYGVQPAHYDAVGAALLWTLAQGLGDAFTPQVQAAWAETYALLAAAMQEGAAGEP